MIAPEVGSTNCDLSDKSPLVNSGRSLMRRISGLLSRRDQQLNDSEGGGYVEFGSMTEQPDTRTLGVFAGVFSPVTLSMFSALIFLRMGYIVGNAGLLVTLLQFVIAYAILIFTVSSVCAISTNGAVEGGGAYFMISRTLGPEFGGSIGTLFFLANVVSSALCLSGCVEGIIENFGPSGYLLPDLVPHGRWYQFLYCSCINTLNLLVCLIGASMFAKTSVFILMIVCGCLSITFFSFFYQGPLEVNIPSSNIENITIANYTGLSSATLAENLYPHFGTDYTSKDSLVTFGSVFGVLFSGVTGIMAGANMSGELKNPGKAIPNGTLSAVLFTCVIYIAISFLTAATCSSQLLHYNYLYLAGINVLKGTVALGLITATWSAALSNVIGGSRVLEALSKDRVFGSVLNFILKGTWNGNPIAAVIFSWFLVEIVLLIGSLNLIAQLNSVLFLLSYLATNLSCLGLELASAPNFRPQFNYFSWHTAFFGLIGTLIMMFVISPIYSAISILICIILVIFLHLFSPSKEMQWGSISQALIFHQVRKYLLLLDSRKDHVKFWRPQVLLLVNSPRTACPLIDFINDLKKGGLYVLGHVVTSDPNEEGPDPTIEKFPHWLNLIDHLKVKAFVELTVANEVRTGLQHLMRISGMGAMKPNTVVLGYLDKQEPIDFLNSVGSSYQSTEFSDDNFSLYDAHAYKLKALEFVQMMGDVLRFNKNLCLCRNFHKLNKTLNFEKQYIDVWPINLLHPSEMNAFDVTSLFMMQLACIVNMVSHWSKLTLRICVCDKSRTSTFEMNTAAQQNHIDKIKRLLYMLRIKAEIYPVVAWNAVFELQSRSHETYLTSCNELIKQESQNTAVTFIYLPTPPTVAEDAVPYLETLNTITENLPPTMLVHGVSIVNSTTL